MYEKQSRFSWLLFDARMEEIKKPVELPVNCAVQRETKADGERMGKEKWDWCFVKQ